MAWVLLIIAGVFEVIWAIGMKKTDGFTRPGPTAWTVGAMIVSFVLLGLAVKSLPVGTAYAIWTGIGAAGTAALGILVYKEPLTAGRVVCILLIVSGVVGLKLVSGPEPGAPSPASPVEPAPGRPSSGAAGDAAR